MKKISFLVISTFIGPFVMTFFISLFVLLMQFLWKYIDDLAGKGLEWTVIFKLMVYVSVTLVPLALPLAMLLASIMTFGNLAEHYELVACKSAGMSVQKIMRPLIYLTVLICIGAFYFSDNVLPAANLRMSALLYDVRNQKPGLLIKPGVFYDGIEGYVIKVGKKDKDNQTIHNVMIYDHTENRGNVKVILADKGTMLMSDDDRYLLLTLYDGKSYEERRKPKGVDTKAMMRTEFQKEIIRFDLSAFKLTRTNEQLFKDNYQMLNLRQLSSSSDSIEKKIIDTRLFYQKYNSKYYTGIPGVKAKKLPFTNENLVLNFEKQKQAAILTSALNSARTSKNIAGDAAVDITVRQKSLYKHRIEWNRKFTLSFAIFILFLIGAPLGSIIRKGGLGMPLVISVIFFLTYHIISITGEKFAREGVIAVYKGMWLSSVLLLPLGIFLMYKATTDSALFDRDAYVKFFNKFIPKKISRTE
ncbi:MAG: LptF/LptG family permease [Bacteroidota bacterium]